MWARTSSSLAWELGRNAGSQAAPHLQNHPGSGPRLWGLPCLLSRDQAKAAETKYHKLSGFMPPRCILFMSWSSGVWNQFTGVKSRGWQGGVLLAAPGDAVSLPVSASCGCLGISWLVAPLPSSEHITPVSASDILSLSLPLTLRLPSHNDSCDDTKPTEMISHLKILNHMCKGPLAI